MNFKYMIVAFLDEQPVGMTIEPPKNPHITVKKKFKLVDINESELIRLLTSDTYLTGVKELVTGSSDSYDSTDNMIIKIKNGNAWKDMHQHILGLLSDHIESRDPHFEGVNYLPHITWRLKGEDNLEPGRLENHEFLISNLYLIERVHPTKSIARIVSKIPLTP